MDVTLHDQKIFISDNIRKEDDCLLLKTVQTLNSWTFMKIIYKKRR